MAEPLMSRSETTFPWLEHYPASTPHAILDKCAGKSLLDLFDDSLAKHADQLALESFGKTLSYADIADVAQNVTAYLQASGHKKGDRVAIMMPNVAAYVPLIFGILRAGCVVVNTNPLYTARELTHQIKDSGAKTIFFLSLFEKTVAKTHLDVPFDNLVRVEVGDLIGVKGKLLSLAAKFKAGVKRRDRIPKAVQFKKILKLGRKLSVTPVEVEPSDLAFLQYTGGTTGVSKGAMLSHANVYANVIQCTSWFAEALVEEKEQHVMVGALPLYHIFALTACAFFTIHIGGKVLLIANPRDFKSFIATLRKCRFTIFVGINTLFSALCENPAFAKVDFSNMLLTVGGGMATKAVVAEKWKKITGYSIVEGYGLSETSPGVTFNRHDIDGFTGTIGFPWPSTDVRILDVNGMRVPHGEIGEICIKGPQVMSGYWKRPEETESAFTKDGYFRSGDMGFMQADGQFKLVDRLKEMILVSGFNVFPNEVEDIIIQLPEVKEVAVVGLPDEHSGELVAAYIVKRDEGLSEEQVRAHCKELLTAYKIPKKIVFKEELPKSNVGKVLRRVLQENALKD